MLLYSTWMPIANSFICGKIDCAVSFYREISRFHPRTDVAPEFSSSESSRLWGIGNAQATPLPCQDPSVTLPIWSSIWSASAGVTSRLEHHWPSSAPVACSSACLCLWNCQRFWAQTVFDENLTVGLFCLIGIFLRSTFEVWSSNCGDH